MANQAHLSILAKGVDNWNRWRREHLRTVPDLLGARLQGAKLANAKLNDALLDGADLSDADLRNADLMNAHMYEANLADENLRQASLWSAYLVGANLSQADLRRAILKSSCLTMANMTGADLRKANLSQSILVGTNLQNADLSGSRVHGISAWDLQLQDTKQQDLVITLAGEPQVTVDDVEMAQFVYFLMTNANIRRAIDTVGKKGVLLLGRFGKRLKHLEALRSKLRDLDFVPIVFSFTRPRDRDFTETVLILAGLCRFIIADITAPRSVPLELQATIPDYAIPFVPILQKGERAFAMSKNLHKYPWVCKRVRYSSTARLVERLEQLVVRQALEKQQELRSQKAAKVDELDAG